ncbi:MAG TPA: 16S rRNA (cytosine(1402)-N(4))-methyltransferase RsmH [Gemmatimonadaceae bacterium]
MSSEAPVRGALDGAYHTPVLVDEVVELFGNAKTILDCTLGGGGHSAAFLALGANVTAIDRDPAALAAARTRLAAYEATGQFHVILGNFAEVDRLLPDTRLKFDGVLADLGVSSHQIDSESRGFSFREGALLDMRMDESGRMSAGELLSRIDEAELIRVLRDYADEPRARRLAREILRRRETSPFETSDDLVRAIRGALGARSGPADFARIFQGIRIAVNDELGSLEKALPLLRDRLRPGGVLAVIAYHSGEDRIVKHLMRDWSRDCVCPPMQPRCTCGGRALGTLVNRKAIKTSAAEVERNPRARSARLRAWQSVA